METTNDAFLFPPPVASILNVEKDGRFAFIIADKVNFTKTRKHSTAPKKKINSSSHFTPRRLREMTPLAPDPARKSSSTPLDHDRRFVCNSKKNPHRRSPMFLLVMLSSLGKPSPNFTTSVLAIIVTINILLPKHRTWCLSPTRTRMMQHTLVDTGETLLTYQHIQFISLGLLSAPSGGFETEPGEVLF